MEDEISDVIVNSTSEKITADPQATFPRNGHSEEISGIIVNDVSMACGTRKQEI